MKKDKRPAVVLRLAAEEEGAWSEFLEEYATVIFQVVRLYEQDEDRRSDVFLFISEHLARDRYRRLRCFRPDGPAKFTTWLRAVSRNLYLDWRRSRFGRHSWMRVAAELPALEREAYRLIVQQGMTISETTGSLRLLYPNLSNRSLVEALESLEERMGGNPRDKYRARRLQEVSLTRSNDGQGQPRERPVADIRPDPEALTLLTESRDRLHEEMDRLSRQDQLLLRLRYEEELTLAEVARLVGLENPQAADRRIRTALEKLRKAMEDDGKTDS